VQAVKIKGVKRSRIFFILLTHFWILYWVHKFTTAYIGLERMTPDAIDEFYAETVGNVRFHSFIKPNVTVRGAPLTELNRSRRTLIKKKIFKTATGRRVPLTDLLGQMRTLADKNGGVAHPT
jgi:hypothetical protein